MCPQTNNNNENLHSRKDEYPLDVSLPLMTEIKPSFMKIVMSEKRVKELWKVMNRLAKLQWREEAMQRREAQNKEEIKYHGPYTDASRQCFFLLQKLVNDRVQGVEYDFGEDLDCDKLMNNLS